MHYCALPIEAEGPTVVSSAIRDSANAASASAANSSSGGGGGGGGGGGAVKAPSTEKTPLVDDAQPRQGGGGGGCCRRRRRRSSGGSSGGSSSGSGGNGAEGDFGSTLLLALLASALLNALVGGAAYVTYARSKHPPRDPISGSTVTGCDEIICDDVIKVIGLLLVLLSVSSHFSLSSLFSFFLSSNEQFIDRRNGTFESQSIAPLAPLRTSTRRTPRRCSSLCR